MVHQNLILDVSFLPIPEQTSTEPNSGTSYETSGGQPQPPDTLRDLAEVDSANQTSSRVWTSSDAGFESFGEDRESEEEDESTHSPIRDSDWMMHGDPEADPAGRGSVGQSEGVLPSRDSSGLRATPKSPTVNDQTNTTEIVFQRALCAKGTSGSCSAI